MEKAQFMLISTSLGIVGLVLEDLAIPTIMLHMLLESDTAHLEVHLDLATIQHGATSLGIK